MCWIQLVFALKRYHLPINQLTMVFVYALSNTFIVKNADVGEKNSLTTPTESITFLIHSKQLFFSLHPLTQAFYLPTFHRFFFSHMHYACKMHLHRQNTPAEYKHRIIFPACSHGWAYALTRPILPQPAVQRC